MRTTIRMNNALAREAKQYAEATGQSFSAVIETALTELLAKRRASSSKQRRIVLPTFGDSSRRITWKQYNKAVE